MRPTKWALILWLGLGLPVAAQSPEPTPSISPTPASKPAQTPSAPGAKAYFVDLKEGASIPPTTTLHFGLSGMASRPPVSTNPTAAISTC